jgi:hypothetical protein
MQHFRQDCTFSEELQDNGKKEKPQLPNVKRETDNQPTPKQLNNERSKYRPNDLSVSVALHSHYISKQIRKSRASIIFLWNAHKQSKRRNRYSGTSKIRDTEYN